MDLVLHEHLSGYRELIILTLEIVDPHLQSVEGVLDNGYQSFERGDTRLQGVYRSSLGLATGLSMCASLLAVTSWLKWLHTTRPSCNVLGWLVIAHELICVNANMALIPLVTR